MFGFKLLSVLSVHVSMYVRRYSFEQQNFFNLSWNNLKKKKKLFVGGYDHFEGKGRLATKINRTFFVGNEVLNIFHLTTFLEKTIFSEIAVKNNFWRTWSFYREMGCRTEKMNITFSMGSGVPNTVLKFFSQKSPYRLNESQKPVLGAHFPPYQWLY